MNDPSMLDKVQLADTPIRIGDKKLELLRVKNIDPILSALEEDKEAGLESFPYWIKIWESSIVLAAHLYDQNLDKNQRVIELGAGMGVVGMFLAAFGHPVTLTDYNDDALSLLKKNAARNNLDSVTVQKRDWNTMASADRYDIVCGAEMVYRKTDINAVFKAIEASVKPDGVVFLAHNIKRISMVDFLAQAGKRFDIDHTGKSITTDNEKKQFVIHTMKPKA